jgi:hypothetical protein
MAARRQHIVGRGHRFQTAHIMNTPFWFTHPSKVTADRVATELQKVGWKTEVVPVGGQYKVQYWKERDNRRDAPGG